MQVYRVQNQPISSNCFIVYEDSAQDCIVIDPGTLDNSALTAILHKKKLQVRYDFLTHEHFDHCAGVNSLYREMPFTLVCTNAALAGIGNSKSNFSEYFEDVSAIEINLLAHTITEQDSINFGSEVIRFIETPGHSPGSMCVVIGTNIFTGDTLLNGTKTPLKLPGSDKAQHQASIEKLQSLINQGTIVYPGHGQPFRIQGS